MAIPILKLRNKDTGKWDGVPVLIGEPAKLISQTTEYQLSDSGITPPSGDWLPEPPATAPGKYLWEKITQTWNKGEPKILYLPVYQGQDGKGTVNSVTGVMPDPITHDVPLTMQNLGVSDYVFEAGQKDGWTWEKWSSGRITMAYFGTHKAVAPSFNWQGNLSGYVIHENYPVETVGDVLYHYIPAHDVYYLIPTISYPDRPGAFCYIAGDEKTSGKTLDISLSIFAEGHWK